MVVTLVGIVTDVMDEQSKKASSSVAINISRRNSSIYVLIPMVVTLLGIVIDVSDVHP
jgi:hypothetical protein